MLINNKEQLSIAEIAKDEILGHGWGLPDLDFYEPRLRAAWDRARTSNARREIGGFSLAAFESLTRTDKNDLRSAPLEYTVVSFSEAAKYYETTGTTGCPTPTPRHKSDIIWNTVSVAHSWSHLLRNDDRVLILLPSDIVPVADLVAGVCDYLDISYARAYPFSVGISEWDRLSKLIETYRPTVAFVAPGVARHIMRLAKTRDQFESIRSSFRALMLLGEVSTIPFRERLGKWWDAEVLDASYGSTETGTLAASCTGGSLHLLPTTTYFELTDGTRTWQVGHGVRTGRLVVTPLRQYARPLLRYDTGDDVEISGGCSCGLATPVVTVNGRSSETLDVTGAALTVRDVETIVYAHSNATAYLIEAEPAGGPARLLLERDVDADRTAEPTVVERIKEASESQFGVVWDGVVFVNTLPAITKSGASQKSWKSSNVRIKEAIG